MIVKNSLKDESILEELEILRSWKDGDWELCEVSVSEEQAKDVARFLDDGPWYVHFWEDGRDDVLVVFKHKTFWIQHSDKETWKQAVEYGQSIDIPFAQLDFLID